MVGGLGDTSYASNSKIQEKAILEAKEILRESISNLYSTLHPKTLLVADLGCSSGINTFMVISAVLDAISGICHEVSHRRPPEVLYFMNDLPGNDFNAIFKMLASHDEKMREEGKNVLVPYYAVGVPGSFHGRLFPEDSMHFMHSSYSLHWLSQVPKGLEDDEGNPINRGNIYISKTSPPCVQKSYLEQFQKDFSSFLRSRSAEIISGGVMVLTFLGRSTLQQFGEELCYLYGKLAEALMSMVSEGHIEEQTLDEFNLPIYAPAMDEVRDIVLSEGSFDVCRTHVFMLNWDPFDDVSESFIEDNRQSGENVARWMRAVMAPLLASHFGEAIIDSLFSRYAEYVAEHLHKEKTKMVNITLSLKKRG